MTEFLQAEGIHNHPIRMRQGRHVELRFTKAAHFVVVLLFTIISATGVASTQTTTGYRQFNLSCRFLCSGAQPSDVVENSWDINVPLPVTGTVTFADRPRDSDRA